jgi:hypothetical protein
MAAVRCRLEPPGEVSTSNPPFPLLSFRFEVPILRPGSLPGHVNARLAATGGHVWFVRFRRVLDFYQPKIPMLLLTKVN